MNADCLPELDVFVCCANSDHRIATECCKHGRLSRLRDFVLLLGELLEGSLAKDHKRHES